MDRDNLNDMILTLVQLLDSRGEAWRDELPIVIDENGNTLLQKAGRTMLKTSKARSFSI